MDLPHFRVLFEAFACFWVGGWGFLAYRYPELTRKAGIFYVAIAVASAIIMLVDRSSRK